MSSYFPKIVTRTGQQQLNVNNGDFSRKTPFLKCHVSKKDNRQTEEHRWLMKLLATNVPYFRQCFDDKSQRIGNARIILLFLPLYFPITIRENGWPRAGWWMPPLCIAVRVNKQVFCKQINNKQTLPYLSDLPTAKQNSKSPWKSVHKLGVAAWKYF